MDVSRTTTGYDTLFYSCSGCVQSILHTEFCFFHLCLGSSAYTDNSYAASQFCQSLLEFLFIELRSGLFDSCFDLSHTVLNVFLVACTVNDNSRLFLDFYRFCSSQMIQGGIFQLKTKLLGDHGTAGQDCDILQHLFSSVAVARCFHTYYLQSTTQFVHDQSGQSLALDILSDDQKLLAGLYDLLQKRQDFLNVGDLLVCDQDVRIIQDRFHFLHICGHISGNITSVELHTFYQVKLGLHGLALLDGDHAVAGNFLHSICYHISNFVITCRDCCYSCHLRFAVYFAAHFSDSFYCTLGCFLHTFTKNDGVRTCLQVFHTLTDHCLCKNGCSCGTVTGYIVGLGSYFFYQLSSHVLESILKLYLFCNGNTIVGDERSAVLFVKNYVSSFGSKRYLYGICQFIHTCCKSFSCVCSIFNVFSHDEFPPSITLR